MAQGLSFTFKGLPKLEKRLDKMKSKASNPVNFVYDRVEDMGEEMAEAAPFEFGELKDSKKVSRQDDTTAVIEFTAAHAIHQEYGTSKMASQPFMRPILDEGLKINVKDLKEFLDA